MRGLLCWGRRSSVTTSTATEPQTQGSVAEVTELNSLLGQKVKGGPENAGTGPKTHGAETGLTSGHLAIVSGSAPDVSIAGPKALSHAPFLPANPVPANERSQMQR